MYSMWLLLVDFEPTTAGRRSEEKLVRPSPGQSMQQKPWQSRNLAGPASEPAPSITASPMVRAGEKVAGFEFQVFLPGGLCPV